jgi:transposase
MDLRERAVARIAAGESVRSVAALLKVSVSSVVKWSQRYRATGSAAPGPQHGHRPKVLLPHRDWLFARMADGAGFTLRGLAGELAERGIKVDYRTLWNFVHAEGLSYKKNRAARRAAPARNCETAGAMEEISRPDRCFPPGLHR